MKKKPSNNLIQVNLSVLRKSSHHLLSRQESLAGPTKGFRSEIIRNFSDLQAGNLKPDHRARTRALFERATHQPGERQLRYEQTGRALILADLAEGDRAGFETARFSCIMVKITDFFRY